VVNSPLNSCHRFIHYPSNPLLTPHPRSLPINRSIPPYSTSLLHPHHPTTPPKRRSSRRLRAWSIGPIIVFGITTIILLLLVKDHKPPTDIVYGMTEKRLWDKYEVREGGFGGGTNRRLHSA